MSCALSIGANIINEKKDFHMERKTLIIITVIMCTVLCAIAAVGQSLFDNPDYRKAKELNRKAENAYEEGDYDSAYKYAEQAREHIKKADTYATMLVQRHRANTLMQRASDRLDLARTEGVENDHPGEFSQAAADFAIAKKSYDAEQYERSIDYSNRVLNVLKGLVSSEPLPKYYKVRLIPRRRDCFWRIAEYEFIYNDPWKWKAIYEANKEKLKNPDNPHLIFPGQVFMIPSINGETREGMYDPTRTYEN